MQASFKQIMCFLGSNHKLLLFAITTFFISCENKFAPVGVIDEPVIPYSIVSVTQNTSFSEASFEVKLPTNDANETTVNLVAKNAASFILQKVGSENLGKFSLVKYIVSGLTAGQVYTLRLTYQSQQASTLTTTRNFTAKQSKHWTRLPHAIITSGDYTGASIISTLFNSQKVVYRYQNETKWDIQKFDSKWSATESSLPQPRHNTVAFPLGQQGGRELVFVGFGYLNDEKIPGKRAYLNDFWWLPSVYYAGQSASVIFPSFAGIQNDIKFFLTYEKAFMLKEDYTGAMDSFEVTWDRKACQSLPEKTGKIATFTINGIGYVVNQLAGQQPHVFAYDPDRDSWQRKADFPGMIRISGTGFSVQDKGYFGLGIDKDGNGLRDLWEYNPAQNIWTFHSEYPGQGNRFLISFSEKSKAYIGWGYETRPIEGSAAKQQVGCTDFWEFDPSL